MSNIPSWSEEQQQRRTIAETCASDLAEHLSGDWVRCDPQGYSVTIASGDRRLTIRPERTGALWRIVITADLPEGYHLHTRLERRQTSVAADRPPAQIAGQVQRRLLTPEYDADIQEARTALGAARDREAALAVALAEFEALLPGARPYPHDAESYTRFHGTDLFQGSFRVNHYATKADIKLDWVPIDVARDIAALIGKYLTAEPSAELEE
jgi:hypothetical protein